MIINKHKDTMNKIFINKLKNSDQTYSTNIINLFNNYYQ